MSAQTLIIFIVSGLPKHPKTPKNTQKRIKIHNLSQKCVLYVLDAKCLKTNEKWTKFAQLAVSVPQVSKFGKTSPWKFKMKEKSTQGKEKSKFIKISPWVKKFEKITLLPFKIQNWHKWSLEFQYLAEKVPDGIFLIEKSLLVPRKSQVSTLVLGMKFLRNYIFGP